MEGSVVAAGSIALTRALYSRTLPTARWRACQRRYGGRSAWRGGISAFIMAKPRANSIARLALRFTSLT